MAIEIGVTRELRNGEPGYVIRRVRALTWGQLPSEYFERPGWNCALETDALGYRMLKCVKVHPSESQDEWETAVLREHVWYSKRHFDRVVSIAREAGARLHEIRKKHQEQAQEFLKKKHETIRI